MNKLTLNEMILENNQYSKKHIYDNLTGTIGSGRRTIFSVCLHKYGTEYIDIASNPIIIFELGSDVFFDYKKIIHSISLEIGENRIDRLSGNQIFIYQVANGLKTKQIGNKIFMPIPFTCLLKSSGLLGNIYGSNKLNFLIEFQNNNAIDHFIVDAIIRFDIIILKNNQNISKICEKYLSDISFRDNISGSKLDLIQTDSKTEQILPIKQNEFYTFALEPMRNNISIKTKFSNQLDRIFIYFENPDDYSICDVKSFDYVTIKSNNLIVFTMDYETLVWENLPENIGYSLPTGVLEIKKEFIPYVSDELVVELYGIKLYSGNFELCLCAQSINYLRYQDGKCGLILQP